MVWSWRKYKSGPRQSPASCRPVGGFSALSYFSKSLPQTHQLSLRMVLCSFKFHISPSCRLVTLLFHQQMCNLTNMISTRLKLLTRDAKSSRYGRYICAILSKAVLIFGPCTYRKSNREHCAVRSVLLTMWSKHKSTNNLSTQ